MEQTFCKYLPKSNRKKFRALSLPLPPSALLSFSSPFLSSILEKKKQYPSVHKTALTFMHRLEYYHSAPKRARLE